MFMGIRNVNNTLWQMLSIKVIYANDDIFVRWPYYPVGSGGVQG